VFKSLFRASAIATVLVCLMGVAYAADLLVVDDEQWTAFFGFYGSTYFADQPEKLFSDTVSWAIGGANPADTAVLLFTYDGTLSDGNPANVDAIGFFNLLSTGGFSPVVDSRLNFATRTDYDNIDLVIFPNFDYSDASAPSPANVIAAGLPFITMEPAHTDELNIGTGVTVFSGTVTHGLVVDNDHVITDEYALWESIPMANAGAEWAVNDVPTDGITTSGDGRVLIGEVPEPASIILLTTAALFGAAGLRRRKPTALR